MKYAPIDSALFVENRQRLTQLLKPNSLVILNSNDIMPTNADGTMRFVQNSDLFYLSGIDQEESVLVLFPDFPDENFREILFLRETSEEIAIWEGHKYTKEEAAQTSDIEKVIWLSQFDRILSMLMGQAEHVYLNTNEHVRGESLVQTRDARFITWCKNHYPLHQYERVAPLLYQLRAVKSTVEFDILQQACTITEQGFRRVLSFVKPGVMEYEIEAEYLHEFVRSRSRGFAYEPIVASGANACVLHYIANDQACQSGELILMDVGAEYANYNADMTRTIPANGRFTDRQKAVYNAVLRVMKEAIQLLGPGRL